MDSHLPELFARHTPDSEPPLPPHYVQTTLTNARRRWHRRLVLRNVTASGVAAVAILALLAGVTDGTPAHRLDDGALPSAQPSVGSPGTAAELLEQIALVSNTQQQLQARDNQFIYRESLQVGLKGLKQTAKTQSWRSVDGSQKGLSLQTLGGKVSQYTIDPNRKPVLMDPTYKLLSSLPTDPDALLREIRSAVTKWNASEPKKPRSNAHIDQETFNEISYLLVQVPLLPKLSAALYRAAAKIAGIRVVPDIVDAAGRHGIGIEGPGEDHSVIIVDKKSHQLLGFEKKPAGYKKSYPTHRYAMLNAGVVDKIHQLPK